jgi:K+-sensing histidine kinase KdpD
LKGNTEKPRVGLGLAVSKQIVSEYNGSLSFISVDKKGSSFSLMMDLEEAESIPGFAPRQDSDEQIDSSQINDG